MSDRETTENFWQVWNSFEWPQPQVPQYRLYYHEDGSPRIYTMEDLDGEYILVSQAVYLASPWNVRVKDGVLHTLPRRQQFARLVRDHPTGTMCHEQDVCIVVSQEPSRRWDIQQHEID